MATSTPIRKVIMVTRIEQKPTSKGKDMWRIIDDKDDFYSVFDEFLRARIKEGQAAAFMVKVEERSGKSYKNIVGIAEDAPLTDNNVGVGELLPDSPAPASSQKTQQTPAPTPPANPVPPPAVTTTMNATVRAKALELAVGMFNAGKISHNQIQQNADEFGKYIAGEQLSSSKELGHAEYAA